MRAYTRSLKMMNKSTFNATNDMNCGHTSSSFCGGKSTSKAIAIYVYIEPREEKEEIKKKQTDTLSNINEN